MRRRTGAAVIASFALALSTPLVYAESAAATADYDRTDVKAAGLSLLLPDTWDISEMNRKQAEKLLKENPDLLAAGTTVETLMGTPLSATWDGDGDTYPNRLLNLEILDERSSLPSPSDVQSQLSAFPGIEDVQAKRTTVARKPAVVATYAQHINRDDGTPTTGSASSYFFVGPAA